MVSVDVDVTPTPSNAPDPEQMAGQGLSTEPELIACAMSYCLRPPPPKLSNSPVYFTPPCFLDFCTQRTPPPQLICLYTHFHPWCLPPTTPPPSANLCSFSYASFIHSFTHSLTHGRAHSLGSIGNTHSQVGPLTEALWCDN